MQDDLLWVYEGLTSYLGDMLGARSGIRTPDQFRERFRRPNLFPHLLRELDLTRALALADKEIGQVVSAPSSIAKEPAPTVTVKIVNTTPMVAPLTIRGDSVALEVEAKPDGDNFVTSLHLLNNGRPMVGYHDTFPPVQQAAVRKWDVRLQAGMNRIQVVAGTVKGTIKTTIPAIEIVRDEKPPPPTLLMLVVGIKEYKKFDRQGVEYADKDAEKVFNTQVENSKRIYASPDAIKLTEGDATKKQIKDALESLRKKASQADNPVTIIFLAGHGKEVNDEFYFLGADADLKNLRETALSGEDLLKAISAINGKVFVFLDTCSSGTITVKNHPYWLAKDREPGVAVICASAPGEAAGQDEDNKSGYFTMALVAGLSGRAQKNSDGDVTLFQLYSYIRVEVPKMSRARNDFVQRPYVNDAAMAYLGDFPLTKP